MNKKIFYVSIFLVLVLFLSGCTGGYPTVSDPSIDLVDIAVIKNVVHEYLLALSNQNWSKAQNLCVYGSDRYYATLSLETAVNGLYQMGHYKVTILSSMMISNVNVTNNIAIVEGVASSVICADANCENRIVPTAYYLQKMGSLWKIYGP